MKLLDKLFGSYRELTPFQWYFPYFFEEKRFKQAIDKYGIIPHVQLTEGGTPELLKLLRNDEEFCTIEYGSRFMIDDNDNLVVWHVETNLVKLYTISLKSDQLGKRADMELDLSKAKIGENVVENNLGLNSFVTYARKSDLTYNMEHYENFVILRITGKSVKVIPFDWFNKSKVQHGHVWPAIARIDLDKQSLLGTGMRMKGFEIKLK